MKINYVNADHTHTLIDLPTNLTIENVIQLFKGSSSPWTNQNRLIKGRFAWGRGYGAFSVSHSDVGRVAKYIADQESHHRKRTFEDEYQLFVKKYVWSGAMRKTVETVDKNHILPAPPG